MAHPNTLEISLLGQRIPLKSSTLDDALVKEVLELVALKLSQAEERSRGAANYQVALLALLDLAEEYVQAKGRTKEFKGAVSEKSERLLSLLEAHLK